MFLRQRPLFLAALTALTLASAGGCRLARYQEQPDMELRVVADSIERLMRQATDLSKPNAVRRMLALYADTGHVISATGGRVTTTRDSLAAGIRAFWRNVGQNMQQPQWIWDHVYVDVPSTRAAVFTGTYRIPHHTPSGDQHEIGGAWTAVFTKRDGRWVIVQEHLSDWPMAPADSASIAADSVANAGGRRRQAMEAKADHTRH